MTRQLLSLATACALGLLAAVPAGAVEQATYTPAALAAAQSAGKPVVVEVTATWCSTCAAQKPIVQSLLKQPKFKDLVLLHVDFDKQNAALRKLGVREQSTFVVYKGMDEVGRSTGDTDKASIAALFDKAS